MSVMRCIAIGCALQDRGKPAAELISAAAGDHDSATDWRGEGGGGGGGGAAAVADPARHQGSGNTHEASGALGAHGARNDAAQHNETQGTHSAQGAGDSRDVAARQELCPGPTLNPPDGDVAGNADAAVSGVRRALAAAKRPRAPAGPSEVERRNLATSHFFLLFLFARGAERGGRHEAQPEQRARQWHFAGVLGFGSRV